jgi:hypothetical protein
MTGLIMEKQLIENWSRLIKELVGKSQLHA